MTAGWKKFLITGLGTGYLRPAPGTWGSAATCVVFGLLWLIPDMPIWALSASMGVVALASTVGCVALGKFTETAFGKKDPSYCTLDEWAGQAVALIALPLGCDLKQFVIATSVAFVSFRVFDIIKPPPARQMEKLPHGYGVVCDDLIAGVFANVAAQLILRLAMGY